MASNYVLSQVAEQDIEDVISYIAQDNVQAAYGFVDTLYNSFGTLVENPYLGQY